LSSNDQGSFAAKECVQSKSWKVEEVEEVWRWFKYSPVPSTNETQTHFLEIFFIHSHISGRVGTPHRIPSTWMICILEAEKG